MAADTETVFDVAVVGGGIAGAGIARDASLRGLRVVLFEKNTFGSGTSSKSSKLIHGGIRYLDLAWKALLRFDFVEFWKNFRFVFFALRECCILEKIAPELVKPIALVIPVYKSAGRSVRSVYLGTLIYSLLGILIGSFRAPRFFWNPEALLRVIPELAPRDLAGGVMIWDHTTDDLALVKATMRSAAKSGAKVFERAPVQGYFYDAARQIYEIKVKMDGREAVFLARKLVNASGPWVDRVRECGGEKTEDLIVPVAGAHLELKQFLHTSVILQAEDERLFFVICHGGHCRVGTTERMHKDPDHLDATEEEIAYLLRQVSRYFPSMNFTKADVLGTDAGIRPLARQRKSKSAHEISREHEIKISPSGVIHVLGVKLTDHRRAAEEVVNLLTPNKSLTHSICL